MGKTVVFWSPEQGHGNVTSAVTAVVSAIGLWHSFLEVALAYTGCDKLDLEYRMEQKLRERGKTDCFERTGVKALEFHYRQGALTSEKIRRCAVPLLFPSVSLFPSLSGGYLPGGGKGKEYQDNSKIRHYLLTEKLKKDYALTMLDVKSGCEPESLSFLEAADLVVIPVSPDPARWSRIISEGEESCKGRHLYLLSGYHAQSIYGPAQFRRIVCRHAGYGKEVQSAGLVYDCGFADAMSEGRALEFFLKNEEVKKQETQYEFMEQSRKLAKQIIREVMGKEADRFFLS